MNKTKRILVIFSIIFNILSIGWEVYDIVRYFMLEPQYRGHVFYLIFNFITIAALITVVVLLSMVVWKGGQYYRARYSLYMIALFISIIMNLFSLATIFLVSSMFVSDWVWVKPDKDDKVVFDDKVEVITKTKEQKIQELRERKEKGEITEEQFQEELIKLL